MTLYKVPVLENFTWQQPVKSRTVLTPPGGEAKGDRYLIDGTGAGGWAAKDLKIAEFDGAAWFYVDPSEGMIVWVENINSYYHYDGSAWVSGTSAIGDDSLEPTGFTVVGVASSTLSFNDASLEFTITGNHDIYIKGVKYTKPTATLALSADTTGLHWFYYDDLGVLSTTGPADTPPTLDKCLIATVYWNTTTNKGIIGRERHGITMDWKTHLYLHDTVGTRYSSGLAGTFTNTTFSIDTGSYYDEDIKYSLDVPETTCDLFYKNGSADYEWTANSTNYMFVSGGNVYYNNGTALTALGANKYAAYWIFATNDLDHPIVSLMGQVTSDNVADARTNNKYESLTLGTLPFKEMKLLYRVIVRNDGTPYEEIADYRSVSNLSSGTYVATLHSSLAGLTSDDHPQYVLADGTRAFSGNWTNTGNTIADLGTVTTVNIDGGTIDGTTIGGSTSALGTFSGLGVGIAASSGLGLIGATASTVDFPSAKVIVSQSNTTDSYANIIGLAVEAKSDGAAHANGIYGSACTKGSKQSFGVEGYAFVDASADTGAANGGVFSSYTTHGGGENNGALFAAANGAVNNAIKITAGNFSFPTTCSFLDTSYNEYLKFAKVNSAVNEVTISNNATTLDPFITASSDVDTNVNLMLRGQGTGIVRAFGYTTATSSQGTALHVRRITTGDMTDGFGPWLSFNIEDNAAVLNTIGLIGAVRSGADNTGYLTFQTYVTGSNLERLRITSAGHFLLGIDAPSFQDPHGNEVLIFNHVASAVNEVTITNAATGTTGPLIAASGETNVDLRLSGKGTGKVRITNQAIDVLAIQIFS